MLSLTKMIAQTNLPPVYEIKSDSAYQQELANNFYQILDDKEGSWTIEQVKKSPISNQFRDRKIKPKGIDTLVNTYWFRFSLKNTTAHDVSMALQAFGDKADFYLFDSIGKSIHFVTGNKVDWSKRNGIKTDFTIPIRLKINETIIIYYKMFFGKIGIPITFKINILNNEKNLTKLFIDNQDDYYTTTSYFRVFLTGFLLLAALFNFFFFLTVKEKMYLYFSLWLISLGFSETELIDQVLARNSPKVSEIVNAFNAGINLFLLLYFFRHYFQTFVYTKRWDKYLIAISFLWLIACVSKYFFPALTFSKGIYISVFLLVLISAFITLFKFKKLGHSNVKPFTIALIPLLLSIPTVLVIIIIFVVGGNKYDDALFSNVGNYLMFSSICWMVLYFTWTLFRRYDQQSKELTKQALALEKIAREKEEERSRLIELQKIELEKLVEERTAELKYSLQNLKATQAQLIQSEKMASLGELTAGIAHEIQNPLNFVNNFSEVNQELLAEMKEEIEKGNLEEVKLLVNDIVANEQKINHHGKRADGIVKGMLQHSRTSAGQKELTDINALCDEYLRLSYHGLRAKDKNFNATMKTDFDNSIGNINIIPQGIGRVILNLLNNAFYAVDEKNKSGAKHYEPTVLIGTKIVNNKVEIKVSDNGNGIPQKVLDKIFQPFFTTKPTGQGTGLGLSLSYDIVKAHGGEIKVETKEARPLARLSHSDGADPVGRGEGATFIIVLPVA